MDAERRSKATQAVLKSIRTGECSAAQYAAAFMTESVRMTVNREELDGLTAVCDWLAKQWPLTPVYQRGAWSAPSPVADDASAMQVIGSFPGIGAAPRSSSIVVDFTGEDAIRRIEVVTEGTPSPQPVTELSPDIRAIINNALANGTPMIVAYVDGVGRPKLSPRGSVQCISGTQLCIWARPTSGGLVASLPSRPAMSLLYRDSRTRTTLTISGFGKVTTDEAMRETVFQLAPEVEQNHDLNKEGTAILIDVDQVIGSSPSGPVLVQPSAG